MILFLLWDFREFCVGFEVLFRVFFDVWLFWRFVGDILGMGGFFVVLDFVGLLFIVFVFEFCEVGYLCFVWFLLVLGVFLFNFEVLFVNFFIDFELLCF